jgi:hypothetical protein
VLLASGAGRDFACSSLAILCSKVAAADPPAAFDPPAAPPAPPAQPATQQRAVPAQPLSRPQTSPENCAAPPAHVDVKQYCASSVLPPQRDRFGLNNYGVQNLFSNDKSTAWVEGKAGPGIGEWILLDFDGARPVLGLKISNGYQKSPEIFARNGRVRKFRLRFSQGEILDRTLEDRQGDQVWDFARPIWAEWVQLVIDEVFRGRDDDTAISKLTVSLARPQ